MSRISEHDRKYRKRLMLISPIVVLAHSVLFIALERVNVSENAITFGYQGPPKPAPEISIMDSRTTESRVWSQEHRPMIVENVLIEGEDKPERERGREPRRKKAKIKRELAASVETPGDYDFRSYASHAPVPYREDYVILKMVKPDYPADALANLQEGYVLVEAYIGASGQVKEAYVRSSYGPFSFESASVDAVKQFLFKPVWVGGNPISFWASFLVRFQIRR